MTAKDILALNFAALLIGSDDPDYVCSVITQLPKANYTEQAFDKLMDGPFGRVEIPDAQCECKAVDGYTAAVDAMLQVIQNRRYPPKLDARPITLEREELSDILRGMRESLSTDSPQTLQ